jgi:hypothetical protein
VGKAVAGVVGGEKGEQGMGLAAHGAGLSEQGYQRLVDSDPKYAEHLVLLR